MDERLLDALPMRGRSRMPLGHEGEWEMGRKMAVLAAVGVAAVLAGEVMPAAAAAAAAAATATVTVTVTVTVTRVRCSSPALVSAVSGAASGATLSLAKRCTYVLTAALPTVAQDLTIDGNRATLRRSTVTGTAAFTILTITAGTVALNQLSFTNGNGAITVDNEAQLTVTGGVFRGNTAANGAAINNTDASVVQATGVSFVGNRATGDGGAMYVFTALGDQITDCRFVRNTAAGSGGAYWDWSNGTAISGSTFRGNRATTGGALFFDDQGPGITGTVVRGNGATGDGGGIFDTEGGDPIPIADSKIIGSGGGGIYDEGAEATVALTDSSPTGNNPDNCEPLNSIAGCTG